MKKQIQYMIQTVVIILAATLSCGEKPGDRLSLNEAEAGPGIEWQSFSKGLEKAREQGRPLFIFFYTDWCVYCKKMDKEVFSDRDVISYMNSNYISIRVNPDSEKGRMMIMGKETSAAQLMGMTGARGYPALMFWDKKQKPVTTLPGYLEKGTFLPVLKYIDAECYTQNISLDAYINGTARCSGAK